MQEGSGRACVACSSGNKFKFQVVGRHLSICCWSTRGDHHCVEGNTRHILPFYGPQVSVLPLPGKFAEIACEKMWKTQRVKTGVLWAPIVSDFRLPSFPVNTWLLLHCLQHLRLDCAGRDKLGLDWSLFTVVLKLVINCEITHRLRFVDSPAKCFAWVCWCHQDSFVPVFRPGCSGSGLLTFCSFLSPIIKTRNVACPSAKHHRKKTAPGNTGTRNPKINGDCFEDEMTNARIFPNNKATGGTATNSDNKLLFPSSLTSPFNRTTKEHSTRSQTTFSSMRSSFNYPEQNHILPPCNFNCKQTPLGNYPDSSSKRNPFQMHIYVFWSTLLSRET